jgi:hypothetical protein
MYSCLLISVSPVSQQLLTRIQCIPDLDRIFLTVGFCRELVSFVPPPEVKIGRIKGDWYLNFTQVG